MTQGKNKLTKAVRITADQAPISPSATTCFFWKWALVFLWMGVLSLVAGIPQTGFAQNPIPAENGLPGSAATVWDLPNPDAGAASIQGFATAISINTGGTIEFKVDVKAPATGFSIKIYRLGYYGGTGAREVADLGNGFTGTAQNPCLYDAATGKTDCSNWSVSAAWTATNAVSGIYLAKLTRNDDGAASHIAFVVRDDGRNADIIFKTSDATWQAYNNYGGNSLYVNGSGTAVPGFNHATKVSYNRPFATRAGGGGGGAGEDWLFNAEYPMIRWLERHGYNVSYTTDVDVDRDPQLLGPGNALKHQVFLSVGHDEYWSAAERTNVEAARDAGMHLAFFSGNEVYWKTRWEDNHRTLVCYKEGTLGENICNADCDPDPVAWTGLWRSGCGSTDSSDGCNPENALTGQISWVGTTGEIQVPGAYSPLRFWRNTGLPAVGTTTLAPGSLGYEWNPAQSAYAASYPAGRILLSNTSLSGETHHLSLYRHAPGGALVFGAGTVQWAWGLDGEHDRGTAAPSTIMQQATLNLLADMGVQPNSLQGLTAATASTDVLAPVSVIANPEENDVLPSGSFVSITGTATDADGVVAGVEVSVDNGATWQVATGSTSWTFNWTPVAEGNYTIRSRAFDDSGNMEVPTLGQPNYIAVTVGPPGSFTCPCTIWNPATTTPGTPNEQDPLALEVGVKFRTSVAGFITGIRFYKGTQNTGNHVGNLWTLAGQNLGTANFAGETTSGWQEVAFNAPIAVAANTTYVASYHTTSGYYSEDENYFATGPGATGVANGPLLAIPNNDAAGPNGVYRYAGTSTFPDQTFNASNYYVDVVFDTQVGPDVTPPVVINHTPANNAIGVAIGANITATFNEPIDPATVTAATFELTSGGGALPATISYNAGSRTATLDPTDPLAYFTTYTATLVGGASGISDVADPSNALAQDYVWSFTTGAPPPPPPNEGPGGPILVISDAANPFSRYPVEMLRALGYNAFLAVDVAAVTAATLSAYDVVILGEMPLTAGMVGDLTTWVGAGGTLIALRPDAQLHNLLGITQAAGSQAEGYLLVRSVPGPGSGIVSQTIQYHGIADHYILNGAISLASLYSSATAATAYEAITQNEVGANGGKAIAFAYDLAKSIVYTRQGNPLWEGQNRDVNASPSDGVIRPNDLFYGNAPQDPQPDWINLDKAQIPQADEQLYLLGNLILLGNLHRKPLPRFWMLPNKFKAAVVMTGDDHAVGLTNQFFEQFITLSPSNTAQAVAHWQAVRGTSYMYPNTPISDATALNYQNQGFEVGIHINTGCNVWTPTLLASNYTTQLGQFAANFPSIFTPNSHRTHCIAWSDYDTQPQVMVANGMRLDVNYYYWPGSWVQNRPGLFTGSALPMRFATKVGELIDCYQVTTQMTDESGQTIPTHITTLLDNAVGPNGYYGVFCANMHTDRQTSIALATSIIAAAQSRNVPVVSSRQMLEWLDGRNGSTFDNMVWNGTVLHFDVSVGTGANNLYGMVPVSAANGQLIALTTNGSPVPYTTEVIKGVDYAFFPAVAGSYAATYGIDNTAPVISNLVVTTNLNGTATLTWDTDEPATSVVDYALTGNALNLNETNPALVISHSLVLSGLTLSATYDYQVTSTDGAGNPAQSAVMSFTMPTASPPPCGEDIVAADFALGTVDPNTVVIPDGDGGVSLKPLLNEEFSGTSLPSGWASGNFEGTNTTVAGGVVTVDGTHVFTNTTYGPGASLAFVATFNSGKFQNVGFSSDQPFNTNPWLTIGQGAPPLQTTLYARASDGTNISLGANLMGSPHTYLIKWNAGNFEFYVDGSPTPNATIPLTVTIPMYVQISDVGINDGTLSVDWLRASPFPASGTYTSRTFDQGSPAGWGTASWNETVPAGTSLNLSVRTGDTPTPDVSWTTYLSLTNGAPVGLSSRYIQYKADFSTSNLALTPMLEEVSITCNGPADVTPPVISNIVVSSAPDGLSATITWDTNEPATSLVDYSTDANNLNLSVSAGALVLAHSLTLTGLVPGTVYYYRVTSVDGSSNSLSEPVAPGTLSFTTALPPCFAEVSNADFAQGEFANTNVSFTGDGVTLAPTVGADFTTPPPVAEWASFPWPGNGTSTVAGGILTVNGARYNTQPEGTTYGPGSSLEFVATFGATDFQHVGFGGGTDLTTNGGIYADVANSWAMFSTHNTGGSQLYARTLLGGGTQGNVPLGNYFGTSHRYRIEWKASEVLFYIDGTVVHTETVSIPGPMRPAISDYANDGIALTVDWIRMFPYLTPGTFTSRVFDAGVQKDWGIITWVADEPGAAAVSLAVRTGNTMDLSGHSFTAVTAGASVGLSGRYIQYQATLTTPDAALTPVLQEVAVACTDSPLAPPTVNSDPVSVAVCAGGNVSFNSTATGNPLPTVQWQVSTDGGASWNDVVPAETSPVYSFIAEPGDDGNQYRAVWTNTQGAVNSAVATLTVNPLPTATISGVSNPICPGDQVALQLFAATGTTPYSLIVNGTTYDNFTVGETFATFNPAELSIWADTGSPSNPNATDNQPIEVGTKFRSTLNGYITGIRFYKGASNTGTHTANLWTTTGTLLATATFTAETASGWQAVQFASPVPIQANTTYIASYFSADGYFAISSGFFASTGVTNGPLTALQAGVDGPNGVYKYGGGFPAGGSNANYWVDVLFREIDPAALVFNLTSITDNSGCTSVGSPLSTETITINPLPAGTLTATATAVCAGDPINLRYTASAGGSLVDLVVNGNTYNVDSGTAFSVGDALAFALSPPVNIWGINATGSLQEENTPVVLGVKFRSSEPGVISGIRFYKGWGNIGTENYRVQLWKNGTPGILLAEGAATLGNADMGWQQIDFPQPIAIAANTTYVASFLSPSGRYMAAGGYFSTTSYTEPGSPLTALANGVDGSNGVYVYSATPDFPTNTFNAANYWVDVAFQAYAPDFNYLLTSIDDGTCATTGNPLGAATVAVNPCPCDLFNQGLVLRLEADRGLDLVAAGVTAWADLSAAGNNLVATGSPLVRAYTGPQGMPFVQFNGVDQKLERTGAVNDLPAGNADRTVFLVARYQAPPLAAAGFVYGAVGTDNAFGLTADNGAGNLAVTSGTTNYVATNGLATGWLTQSMVLSAGTLTQFKNGELIQTVNNLTFATNPGKIVLGADIAGTGYAQMDVAAVLVYDRALRTAERQEIEGYLQAKYFGLLTDDLALHLEADKGVAEALGTVSSWTDQSVQANDLTAVGDPQWVIANGPNGQSYVAFDGAGDKFERTSNVNGLPLGAANRTVFLVTRYHTATPASNPTTGLVYGTNSTAGAFGLVGNAGSGNLGVTTGGGTNLATTAQGLGAGWLVQSAVYEGGTLRQYKNGTLLETTSPALNTVAGALLLGGSLDGSGSAMDLAAVLVYDRALTVAERLRVEAYLQHKYFGLGNACINLSAVALLQGPLNTTNGLMNDDLRQLNLLPVTDPYPQLGFQPTEGRHETVDPSVFSNTGNDAIVDWVFLELRSAGDNTQVVASRSALLQRDGDIVDRNGITPVRFLNVPPGDYFVAVRHRNHLAVLTLTPVKITRTAGVRN